MRGEEFCPFLLFVWTSARRRFRSLGVPFSKEGVSFPFSGVSFSSPQRARSVFLLSAVWLKVQSESNPRTGFGILRCFYSFARPFSLASLCYTSSPAALLPCFLQDRGFTLVCSDSLASAADGVAFFFLRLVSPLEVFFFPVPGLSLRRRLLQ